VKASDIREKTEKELLGFAQELDEKIFRMTFSKGTGQLKQTSEIGKARKDLARVKTILRERKLEAEKEAR
jgi:large subunit ribosomal protein L29